MERERAAQLLADRFGHRAAPVLVDQLLRRTGGDLDLLAEISDQVDPQSDGLGRVPIQWPSARIGPARAALAGLGPDGREVVEAACVIGREFDLAILERVAAGVDVVAGLDEAMAAGVVHLLPRQVYGFVLATTREVCYDSLGVRRRAELHEGAAQALTAMGAMGGNRSATLAELAHHTTEAALLGGPQRLDRAVAASCAAAQVSGEEGSHGLSAEFFAQAALLAGRAGWEPGPAGRLLVAAGAARLDAATHEGAREAGRASLLGALRLGRGADDSGLVAAAALALGPPATLGALAPPDRALPADADRADALHEALRADLDGSTRARVRARLAVQTGRADIATDAYTEARTNGDPRAVAEALLAVVHTGASPDQSQPADQALAQATREAEALGDLELRVRAGDLAAATALRAGTRQKALRHLDRLAALDDRKATAFVRWYVARAGAEAARLAGRPDWTELAAAALAAGMAVDPLAAQESDRALRAEHTSQPHGSLTPREREVLGWALRGASAREIAEALVLGERTVETHLASIYRKLEVRSKIELIAQYSEGQ